MELINTTDLSAELFRAVLPRPDRLLGVVVAKATYRVDARGRLARDLDDAQAVSRAPIETPWGALPGDNVPRKDGVDLLCLGNAYPHAGRPARSANVTLVAGEFGASVQVFGDRRWRRRSGRTSTQKKAPKARPAREGSVKVRVDDYVPEEPEEFAEMPMRWEYSYGGEAAVGEQRVPCPDNPVGRGYLVPGADVEGTRLPNFEDPGALLRKWNDPVRPLNFAPMPRGSLLAAEGATTADPDTGDVTVHPRLFNAAHPRMRTPELRGAEVVELTGMTRDAPLRFRVPVLALALDVALEDRRHAFTPRIDTLCVLPEVRAVVLTYRCSFTYTYRPEETRLARLSVDTR